MAASSAVSAPAGPVSTWAKIVRSPSASPMVRAVLTNASLVELKETRAVIACPARYVPNARQRLAEITTVFEKELGRKVEVVIEDQNAAPQSTDTAPESSEPAAAADSPPALPITANPLDDPLVKTAVELFSARIVSVARRPQ